MPAARRVASRQSSYGRVGLVAVLIVFGVLALISSGSGVQTLERSRLAASTSRFRDTMSHQMYHISTVAGGGALFDDGDDALERKSTASPTPQVEIRAQVVVVPSTPPPVEPMAKTQPHERQTFEDAFAAYAAVHNRIATSGIPQQGVLTLHCWGGFNNCALASASALILAMLTNRTLLVHRNAEQEAFARSVDQSRLKWVMDGAMVAKYHEVLGQNIPGVRGEWRMESPAHVRVDSFPISDLMCSDYAAVFSPQLVDIHANNYFIPAIAANPRYRAKIQEWFGHGAPESGGHDGDDVPKYARVYRQLVGATPRVLEYKTRFLNEVTGGTGNCIAVQVRTTMNKDNNQAAAALKLILAELPADVKPNLYVVSDNQNVRAVMSGFAREHGLQPRFVTSVPLHDLAREENFEYSIAETLAAAECEWGLVVTRGSTFGYTITALSKARVVYRFGGSGAPDQPLNIRLDGKFREPIYHGQFQGYPPRNAHCYKDLNLDFSNAFGWRADMT